MDASYVFLELVPYYHYTVVQQKSTCWWAGIQTQPKGGVQYVAQTVDWKMSMVWKTRERACCQDLPLKPSSKKSGNEKSDHNRLEQQYAYQFILFRSVNVQYLMFRDRLCQMGFKPRYGCELSFLLTCTILSLYSCATEIYMLVSWNSNSAKGRCTVCCTNLWLKNEYGLKNKGAGVLPACCDIDRACPS